MNDFCGEQVLITGGAGFIGSNLAHKLVEEGNEVTILDTMDERYGANQTNICQIRDKINFVRGDVRDPEIVSQLIDNVDVVFHMAAQLSRTRSMVDPIVDIDINCCGMATVLQAIQKHNPEARLVFTSSQAVYGVPNERPLTEDSVPDPIDIYGANKLAAEKYCSVYATAHDIETFVLRLTNVYGPRAQLQNPEYGVINRFIRLALQGETLPVYEPGTMKRDPIYIGDVVSGLLAAAQSNDETVGEPLLLASGVAWSIRDLAEAIVDIAGSGEVEIVPWPEDWDSIRIGDITTDPTKTKDLLKWEPRTNFQDGLETTIRYYKRHWDDYVS